MPSASSSSRRAPRVPPSSTGFRPRRVLLAEAEKVAKDSDVVILCVGLNGSQEGEGRDRTAIELPDTEENLVKSMIATGKPVVVVLTSGSALAVNYAAEHAAAILSAWYGGEEAGSAIADTLAGSNNPAGRLPVTFYKSTSQLPAFADYNMTGHTYRYFRGEPLYPFGFGLSYSTFQYFGPDREAHGQGGGDPGDGQEHVGGGRRRRGAVVCRRRPRGGRPDPQSPRLPADSSSSRREPASDVHRGLRRPAEEKVEVSVGGGQPLAWHSAPEDRAVTRS